MPVENHEAVFADKQADGSCRLISNPIDLLALANATTKWWRGHPGKVYDTHTERVVVGVEMVEGTFQICQEADNFAGLCRAGDDISRATWFLKPEYKRLLEPSDAT
jgi:hypothetical protein